MVAQSKKASVSSEVVIGAAAASLKKGLGELKNVVEELLSLEEKSSQLQLGIAGAEDKLKELDVQFVEKLRAHNVEFDLKVKERAMQVVEQVLGSQHLVAVPKQELDTLNSSLTKWQTDFETIVKKEVASASGAIAGNFSQKEKLLEADYRAKEAQNLASIEGLKLQVQSLMVQVEDWKDQLVAERAASVEKSKAGAIGAINVGTQDARR